MDPTALALIATTTVNVLSPFLKKFAEGIGEGATITAGTAAWGKAAKLFDAVKSHLAGTPAEKTLEDLKAAPSDETAKAALRTALADTVDADEAFAKRLAELLQEADNVGIDRALSINIRGDVANMISIMSSYGTINMGR